MLKGDSGFGSVGRLGYAHNFHFSCWSDEVNLIGKTAETSMEELRYEHGAKSMDAGSTVTLNEGVFLR